MTLGDFLDRVDIEKDRDKMLIINDHVGWANIDYITKDDCTIDLYTPTHASPFSSDL